MLKLVRVGTAAVALEDELGAAPLDGRSVERLDRDVGALLVEVGSCLPDELLAELGHLVAPLQHAGRTPDEVRLTLGLVIGWVNGVIQSAGTP